MSLLVMMIDGLTMLLSVTLQVKKSVDQGADMVTITVQGRQEALACYKIREQLFQDRYALGCHLKPPHACSLTVASVGKRMSGSLVCVTSHAYTTSSIGTSYFHQLVVRIMVDKLIDTLAEPEGVAKCICLIQTRQVLAVNVRRQLPGPSFLPKMQTLYGVELLTDSYCCTCLTCSYIMLRVSFVTGIDKNLRELSCMVACSSKSLF